MWPASTSSLSWGVWLSYLGSMLSSSRNSVEVVSWEALVCHFRPTIKLFLCASVCCGDLNGVPVGLLECQCILLVLHGLT